MTARAVSVRVGSDVVGADSRSAAARAQDLVSLVCAGSSVEQRRAAFLYGWSGGRVVALLDEVADVRARYGFDRRPAPLLTPPGANAKLSHSGPAFGLTLSAHRPELVGFGPVRSCPWSGQCASVCVVNRGGRAELSSVQRGRLWKTHLLVADLEAFAALWGAELRREVLRFGRIWHRPNVNSDVVWSKVFGDLFDGLDGVQSYGYSKRPGLLRSRAGGAGTGFHEVFSWSEWVDHPRYSEGRRAAVRAFVAGGGSVAVVTDRRIGQRVEPGRVLDALGLDGLGCVVVDADVDDRWVFAGGGSRVVGDLSAKGLARRLVGRPRSFVVSCYG